MRKKTEVLSLALILLITGMGMAQTNSISPYSRYGLGDLQPDVFVQSRAMGGIGAGLRDPLHINVSNPASYSALKYTSFESALFHKTVNMVAKGFKSEKNSNTSLSYLALAFPIGDRVGFSAGLVPFSSVGYSVAKSQNDFGGANYIFEGSGGLNRFYMGAGVRVTKQFSVGVNGSYLFGTMEQINSVRFDSTDFFNSRYTNSSRISDAYFNYGLQYHDTLKNKMLLNVGLVFGASTNMRSFSDELNYTYIQIGETEITKDTLTNVQDQKGTIKLPSEGRLGFTIGRKARSEWMLGADYSWKNWSEYRRFGRSDSLENSSRFSVGGYVIPRVKNPKNYFQRIQYRFGAHYEQSYLKVNGQQINDYGISFGFGLPVYQRKLAPDEVKFTTLNISLAIGRRGTDDHNLIREDYMKLTIGLTLNDKWFIKRKYK